MPRIPAQLVQLGRQAGAADFGAQQGQALAQTSEAAERLGQIGSHIFVAQKQAQMAQLQAQTELANEQDLFEAENDSDLDTLAERLQKKVEERNKAASEQLPAGFRPQFEAALQESQGRTLLRAQRLIQGRRIQLGQAQLSDAVRLSTDQMGRTQDPRERLRIRKRTQAALDGARASNLISPEQHDQLLRHLDKTVGTADRLAAVRADPLAALRAMKNPDSPLLAGLDPAEVEQARSTAQNELESQLAQQRAAVSFQQAQIERGEKKVQAEIQKAGDELLYSGQLGKLLEFMHQNRGAADPADLRHWGESIARGGPAADVKTDPGTYIELSNRAARGDVIGSQADDQVRAGRMTREDRDRIVTLSEKRRFTSARDLIEGSTQQGFLDFDTARQAKRAEALKEFDDSVAQHPEWTAPQADQHAREILKAYGFKDALAKRKTTDPTLPNGQVNTDAALQEAFRQFGADPAALKAELRRIQQIDGAQQLQGMTK